MPTAPHVLIVTVDPHDPDPDLYDYEIECPGVTDSCRRYDDCLADETECEALESASDNEQPTVAHGKRHRKIDGTWMAETGQCYVQGHDRLPDAVAERFEPGRHAVDWDSGDGTELEVFALNDAVKES